MKIKSLLLIGLLSGCLTQIPLGEKDETADVTVDKPTKIDTQTSAGNPSSYHLLGQFYKVLAFSNDFKQQGIASWYGDDFHGKKTSNGEIYNMYGMTAAHKTLPIPSYVKVTNVKNNLSITVRINDRGPYHDNRVIDLSYAAAQALEIEIQGTEQVEIEAINPDNNNSPIYLQLGVFNEADNARNLQYKVRVHSLPTPTIKPVILQGKMAYKVQIGPLYTNTEVDDLTLKLVDLGVYKTRYVR
ncbi:MAG: septal ring lytic transglycosylase RlpA family protein [Methylococcales bacterium]|nr:septal ring lytic transglycosylase RlpA family protein [Methylococcales bacterium]